MSFLHKHFSRIKILLIVLTLVHFFYFLLKPKIQTDLREWEKTTCQIEKSREIVDLDCRYYHTKKWLFGQPVLSYGEGLQCHQLKTEKGQQLFARKLENSCGAPKYWGTPQQINEIGWDAYSIWWGRAALLYQRSKADDWPGLGYALLDKSLITSFPNKEHHHYPWLLSVFYYSVMKIIDSPNPFLLQGIHFCLWILIVFLFASTWKKAPKYLLIMFAFVPTSAIFMTRLYADAWIVFEALLVVWAFQRRQFWLMVLAAVSMALTKQEAVIQAPILLFALYGTLKDKKAQKGELLALTVSVFLVLFSFFFYSSFKSDFYISISERLQNSNSIGLFFRKIIPYYLDVLFRPALWGLLWPWSMFLIYQSRKSLGVLVWLPVLILLAIPAAYLSFPFGHKEVVLTGSGRALWQALPLLWVLLQQASKKNKSIYTTCD